MDSHGRRTSRCSRCTCTPTFYSPPRNLQYKMCIGMFLGVKIPRNSPQCTCTIYSTSAPVYTQFRDFRYNYYIQHLCIVYFIFESFWFIFRLIKNYHLIIFKKSTNLQQYKSKIGVPQVQQFFVLKLQPMPNTVLRGLQHQKFQKIVRPKNFFINN